MLLHCISADTTPVHTLLTSRRQRLGLQQSLAVLRKQTRAQAASRTRRSGVQFLQAPGPSNASVTSCVLTFWTPAGRCAMVQRLRCVRCCAATQPAQQCRRR